MLSRDEFDAIEFSAARTGDHREAAVQMGRLAATSVPTGEMSRAEAYLRAGEQWLLADDPSAAADGFRRALADGGYTSADARVSLARAMFLLEQADEARALIRQLEEDGRTDPKLCDLVAELLVERSDLPGALEWATAGVELCLGESGQPQPAPAGLVPQPQTPGDEPSVRPGAPPEGVQPQGTPSQAVQRTDPEPPGTAAPQAAPSQATASPTTEVPGAGNDRWLASVPRQAPSATDTTELRMLLSLRYRIRNDLGLPEDRYDKLLDEL